MAPTPFAAWTPGRGGQPTTDEARALWQGGGWTADVGSGGAWVSGYRSDKEYGDLKVTAPNAIPLKPAPLARSNQIRRELGQGRAIFAPFTQCHPAGMPYALFHDYDGGFQVLVGDKEMIWAFPNMAWRRIHLDGRPHPPEGSVPALYMGDSVARWEGRVLVIDTTNIRGSNTQWEPYTPKAEGSHIVERYTPISPGLMDVKITITNPDFTRPWVLHFHNARGASTIFDDVCTDANRWAMGPGGGLTMRAGSGAPLEKAEP